MRHYILFALCSVPLLAQVAQPSAFDVASVKPTQHGRTPDGWSRSSADIPSPGRFEAVNSSLDELIRFAYQVKDYQVSGPNWLNDDDECFDIAAKAPPDTPKPLIRAMLQTLLAERFKLALHRETRTLPVYALVKGKTGAKLPEARSDPGHGSTTTSGGTMTAKHVSMTEFAYQLSRNLGRPVYDQTGIEGSFDFTLQYDEREGGYRSGLAAAVQEQLGLRLEPTKGPVEMLVIDHIEKVPTEN